MLLLEAECRECRGVGCPECHELGLVPTELGDEILNFYIRHMRTRKVLYRAVSEWLDENKEELVQAMAARLSERTEPAAVTGNFWQSLLIRPVFYGLLLVVFAAFVWPWLR